ncbi:GTPase activating protein Gyp7 [Schizosaccharomyces cryophilus OY26]|uniref:GTPase activating protein Gyp7 n=1 Tax=Schizosaccharomyces cryophilus (strain OY26 / ATCC MYA-4695 / CBS 11777 / NBRC 106824 / NRRL Y48691) TaxID=653667 RepID=S9X097_SCHCR|nr:GTPase activating protein Gyp7 [Schizosaccharomyces cryophilus OY26]EPY50372.1 GTPase activating protein Gyp7 [Schizosaccharomyces cryophilus OY26]
MSELEQFDIPEMAEVEDDTVDIRIDKSKVALLFSKSKVCIHPTSKIKDNISGYLSLSKTRTNHGTPLTGNDILLSWVPDSFLRSRPRDLNIFRTAETSLESNIKQLVEIPEHLDYSFSVRLNSIYSIIFRPPKYGWNYGSIVINLRNSGESLPPLFFHDDECSSTIECSRRITKDQFDPFDEAGDIFWGGTHLIMHLKKYVNLENSTHEPQLYLVNPSPEDTLAFQSNDFAHSGTSSKQRSNESSPSPKKSQSFLNPFRRALQDLSFTVLERFSRVTNYGKSEVDKLMDHKVTKSLLPHFPREVQVLFESKRLQKLTEEYDPARIFLAKWAAGVVENSEISSTNASSEAAGLWSEQQQEEDSSLGPFELVYFDERVKRGEPLTVEQWKSSFNSEGKLIVNVEHLLGMIFHGGVVPSLRKEVWPFLLSIYPWDSTENERKAIYLSLQDEYIRLKRRWYEDITRQFNDRSFIEQRNRIEKDVHRTDRQHEYFQEEDLPHPDPQSTFTGTNLHMEMMKDMLLTYNEYDTELGYVQGMSDLLAPIYVTFGDNALAFWGMVGLMKRLHYNFLRDQSGMQRQLETLRQLIQLMDKELYIHLEKTDSSNLFCFFRMLLIYFKREFDWEILLKLWDVLFTNYLSYDYHIFFAYAIAERHREVLLNQTHAFDEVLKYFNELSGKIALEPTLVCAEQCFYRFNQTVSLIDRKRHEERENNQEPSKTLPFVTPLLRNLLSKKPLNYGNTSN